MSSRPVEITLGQATAAATRLRALTDPNVPPGTPAPDALAVLRCSRVLAKLTPFAAMYNTQHARIQAQHAKRGADGGFVPMVEPSGREVPNTVVIGNVPAYNQALDELNAKPAEGLTLPPLTLDDVVRVARRFDVATMSDLLPLVSDPDADPSDAALADVRAYEQAIADMAPVRVPRVAPAPAGQAPALPTVDGAPPSGA
jgi:hypothetical protein